MGTAVIRAATLVLLAAANPVSAQDFAFRQDCTLTLYACDILRDGAPECPAGQTVAVKFWTEGDSFNLSADGLGDDPVDGVWQDFSLGQGYFTDDIRVYYFMYDTAIDGIFWIAADGKSGAHLTRNGLEDYFTAICTPLPD